MDISEHVNSEIYDQQYTPFPAASAWAPLSVDRERWDTSKAALEEREQLDPSALARAREVAKRAAAIDTGALEGLYDLDRGFTITVAAEAGYWQAAYEKAEQRVRSIIESQLTAYDEVLDFATGAQPIIEAWVRQLHRTLCANQGTYTAKTQDGSRDLPLELGVYKRHPNHVLDRDGRIHAYAPVYETASEMARLIRELQSDDFIALHPAVQAAFAHYAFVCVHPFADGNGRVARALSSVFTYRAASIPLLVLMEHRDVYLDALAQADTGSLQPLVNFVVDRSVDAFSLASESLRAAQRPSADTRRAEMQKLYRTRGGYTHAEVDLAGSVLLDAVSERAAQRASELRNDTLSIDVQRVPGGFGSPPRSDYRVPVTQKHKLLTLGLRSAAPAHAELSMQFCYWVPRDAGEDDHVMVTCLFNGETLRVPIKALRPRLSTVAELQISMYLEGIFAHAMEAVHINAQAYLRERGY